MSKDHFVKINGIHYNARYTKILRLDENTSHNINEVNFEKFKLERLYVNYSKITIFSCKTLNYNFIKILDLSHNILNSICPNLYSLVNLNNLALHHNKITELSESIGQLVNLEELYINSNSLTKIPESIGKLTKLTVLYLDDNLITELPEKINNLTKLQTLTLNKNKLTKLPELFSNLTNLRNFYLEDNMLTNLPNSIKKIKCLPLIDDTSYQLDNLDLDCNFLIFVGTFEKCILLDNLPPSLKKVFFFAVNENYIKSVLKKVPFGCKVYCSNKQIDI